MGRQDSNLRMAESKSAALPLGDAPKRPRRDRRRGQDDPYIGFVSGGQPTESIVPHDVFAFICNGRARSRQWLSRSTRPASLNATKTPKSERPGRAGHVPSRGRPEERGCGELVIDRSKENLHLRGRIEMAIQRLAVTECSAVW